MVTSNYFINNIFLCVPVSACLVIGGAVIIICCRCCCCFWSFWLVHPREYFQRMAFIRASIYRFFCSGIIFIISFFGCRCSCVCVCRCVVYGSVITKADIFLRHHKTCNDTSVNICEYMCFLRWRGRGVIDAQLGSHAQSRKLTRKKNTKKLLRTEPYSFHAAAKTRLVIITVARNTAPKWNR